MDWTKEQILGLAPDHFTLRAGLGVATPQKWIALHHAQATCWGLFPISRQKTVETAVFLPNFAYTCSCNSRKAPCRHVLGLLLLWQQAPQKFTNQPLPATLTAWVKQEQHLLQPTTAANGRFPTSRPSPQKMNQLLAGLNELELWLLDMVRHGLASLPERPKTYWGTMANRLVDAQANDLAQTVRQLANIPSSQPDWPETLLQQIGRLYLIIQGFQRFAQLPPPVQADLQTAVGWLPQTTNKANIISDNWLVLGRQQETVGKQTRHITWLWGQNSQMIAQLIDLPAVGTLEGSALATNSLWQGSLRLLPGSWPLGAVRHGRLQTSAAPVQPIGYQTIRAASQTHNEALAANPWLTQFPMLLHNTQPSQTETGWQLLDETGTSLPLPPKYAYGWHLAAIAGNGPSLTLFGVWNGRFLQPLTALQHNQWLDIHIWQGVR
ncbi:MAG: SWIM zinc finger family protein [Ardenticatenaceae bacterium]|nr:SWIM zinc finger family protein [Ardenticatenaceae bacterium]